MPFPDGIPEDRLKSLLAMRIKVHELEDYVTTLLDLRREYEKDIKIFIGFEVEYFASFYHKFLELISDYPIDYLILGQHFPDPTAGPSGYYGNRVREPERLPLYVDTVIEAIKTDTISYIAHPDIPACCPYLDIYEREMSRLIETANEHRIPLEINFYGMQELRNYPSLQFWQLAARIGCDVVFGSDAHRPENMCEAAALKFAQELVANNPRLHLLDTVELKSPVRTR